MNALPEPRFGWMTRFKDTQGIVIDVRGNSGGSKHVLFRLFPYFVKPDAPLRVLEMSVFRKPMDLPQPNPGGFMRSDMSGQPVTSSRWKNDAQRKLRCVLSPSIRWVHGAGACAIFTLKNCGVAVPVNSPRLGAARTVFRFSSIEIA